MSGFHEFDVALSPNTPAAGATSRIPTNEAHINVWASGAKGTVSGILSNAVNVGAGIGLVLVASRVVAMNNAPAELILGDASGAWLLNIADLNVLPTATTLFSGVYLS